MAEKITIHAAKTNLSKLIARVEAGEEIVIYRGDKPAAKLVAANAKASPSGVAEEQNPWGPPGAWDGISPRKPGLLKGQIVIPDGFFDPWSAKDFGQGAMDNDPEWGDPGAWDGKTPRKPGALRGEIKLDDSFFDPLSDEELGLANGDEPKP